ncbi:hypothetical protein BBJ67_03510 [Cutibacterium acnes]|nr:hypothetical protein ALW22_03165 [Cutibacterium acnes]OFO85945.1 hypothetical protein HMPREF3013_11130 [Propionibacterium sp. HMSC062D05]OFP25229.1 hypothetical protein HMPREF2995_00420 [Propionibacterium sp. HMSC062D02]OEU32016.1 hypothetical protein BBJ67_03510 [Cutibacterium acnes]PKC20556.1 hypothetical protein APS62_03855 [Cutibacterium acnes]
MCGGPQPLSSIEAEVPGAAVVGAGASGAVVAGAVGVVRQRDGGPHRGYCDPLGGVAGRISGPCQLGDVEVQLTDCGLDAIRLGGQHWSDPGVHLDDIARQFTGPR